MSGVKIYIDYVEIDLGRNAIQLPITYQLIDVKQIDKRKGSTTKTVKVPRTTKNDKIFGFAFDINAENNFNKYSEHKIVIEQDSYSIFNGFMKITSVDDDVIEFFCYADISKLKNLFGEKSIQTLNLSDLDHVYDATIFDTWSGTYPSGVASDYVYPLIDYGRFQTLTPENDPEAPDLLITDFYPATKESRIIKQICVDNGYSLVSSFYEKPIPSKVIVPFTNEEFLHSVVGGIEVNGLWAYNTAQQTANVVDAYYTLEGDTEVFDALLQWNGTEYEAGANQTTRYEFAIQVEFPSTSSFLNAPSYFIVEVDRGSGYVEERREQIERPNRRIYFENNYIGVLNLSVGDKVRFRFLFSGGVVSLKVKAQRIVFDPSAGGKTIDVGEFVQIAPNLPDVKQAEFFKSCYQRYNWIINVDDNKGVVYIETFEDFYSNANQVDWSKLLTLSPKPKIQYLPVDYSRNYDFKYKHDGNDFWLTRYDETQANAGYLFGDGKFYLDENGDATLVGEVAFSPTIVEKSFKGGFNYIELPTMLLNSSPTEKNTAHEPRVLIYGGMVDIATLSNGVYSALYVEDFGSISQVPFAYFQKKKYGDADIDGVDGNLSFSTPTGEGFTLNNLVDTYWASVIQSLSVSPQVTAYFNLTPKEVGNLDFMNLIYLDYFSATFRINRIVDYLPNSLQPTKVELIKVGIFNPNKQDYVSPAIGNIYYLNTENLFDIDTEDDIDIII